MNELHNEGDPEGLAPGHRVADPDAGSQPSSGSSPKNKSSRHVTKPPRQLGRRSKVVPLTKRRNAASRGANGRARVTSAPSVPLLTGAQGMHISVEPRIDWLQVRAPIGVRPTDPHLHLDERITRKQAHGGHRQVRGFGRLPSGIAYGVDTFHGGAPEGWLAWCPAKKLRSWNDEASSLDEALDVFRRAWNEARPLLRWQQEFECMSVTRLDLCRDFRIREIGIIPLYLAAMLLVRVPYAPTAHLEVDGEWGPTGIWRRTDAWMDRIYDKAHERLAKTLAKRGNGVPSRYLGHRGKLRFEAQFNYDALVSSTHAPGGRQSTLGLDLGGPPDLRVRTIADLQPLRLATLCRLRFDRGGYGRTVMGWDAIDAAMRVKGLSGNDQSQLVGYLTYLQRGGRSPLANPSKYKRLLEELGLAPHGRHHPVDGSFRLDYDAGQEIIEVPHDPAS